MFFSWSGDKSKQFAELFKKFLKSIEQTTNVWISTTGIEKGTAWFAEIGNNIKDIDSGIVFLTKANQNNAWLLFESGAFYKGDNKNNIYTFLIDLDENEIDTKSPFYHLNHTKFNKDDIKKLVAGISKKLKGTNFSEIDFNEYFERDWNTYKDQFNQIIEIEEVKKDSPPNIEKTLIKENLNNQSNKSLVLLNDLYKIIGESNVAFNISEISDLMRMKLRKLFASEEDLIEIKFYTLGKESIRHIRITEKGLNYLADNI